MSSSEASVAVAARRGASAQRSRPVHASAFRASVRAVPLRSVQLAPSVRPVRPVRPPAASAPRTPTVTVVPDPRRRPLPGLRDLPRRAALWGGGARGEYLAWRTPEPAPHAPLRGRLRALTRRIALWGAGPRGEHLAWGGPAPVVPAPRPVDPPVVLRELPSTLPIRPAAPSPAVALLPAPVAPAPGTEPTVLRATATAPRVAAPVRSRPGRTVPAARCPSAEARAGPARARGDPTPRSAPRRALTAPG